MKAKLKKCPICGELTTAVYVNGIKTIVERPNDLWLGKWKTHTCNVELPVKKQTT